MGNALNVGVMREFAEQLQLPSIPKEDAKLKVHLERSLATRYPDSEVMECTDCGFECPDTPEITRCPGCGELFAEEGADVLPIAPPAPPPPKAKGKKGKAAEKVAAPEAPEAASEAASEAPEAPGKADPEPPKSKGKKAARAPEPAAKSPKSKGKTAKANDAEPEKTEGKTAAKRGKAKPEETIQELEAIESRIDTLARESKRIEWDIGHELNQIYDRDLWLERAKSFPEYVRSRFSFTVSTARAYMRIARTFSKQDAEALPLSHVQLISKVDSEEERQRLAQKVKENGLSKRELAEDVKVLRQAAGLKTERAGLEGTVVVTGRLKPGVVADGQWAKTTRGGKEILLASFEVGGHTFTLEDHGAKNGWILRLSESGAE